MLLPGNSITDLTPLAVLADLRILDLSGNRVVDVTPLASRTRLTHLNLDGNRIVDLTPLTGLRQLQVLTLDNNLVRRLDPILDLPSLQSVELSGNPLSDTGQLQALSAGGARVESRGGGNVLRRQPENCPQLGLRVLHLDDSFSHS